MHRQTDEMDEAYELAGRLAVSVVVCAVALVGMLVGLMFA